VTTEPRITGAVLAGGRSRRMGRDKASIEVGGHTLLGLAVAALRSAGADPVLVVGGDPVGRRVVGVVEVADDHPGEGPLGGILTALRHPAARDADVVVVTSCDLPFADGAAIRSVVDALLATPGSPVAAPLVADRLEPLHAAWRPSSAGEVAARFEAGERSPTRVLADLRASAVGGVPDDAVRGVNTPDELAEALRGLGPAVSGQTGGMTDSTNVPEISVAELAARQADAWILDVRQPDEYEEGHVPGAVLIPLDQLNDRHAEVPTDADVYVVCRSGGRSAAAVQALNGAGYRTTNVAGGTMAWIEAGHPVVSGSEPS
jgi:molybdenum cofactor guanylyltransferase